MKSVFGKIFAFISGMIFTLLVAYSALTTWLLYKKLKKEVEDKSVDEAEEE